MLNISVVAPTERGPNSWEFEGIGFSDDGLEPISGVLSGNRGILIIRPGAGGAYTVRLIRNEVERISRQVQVTNFGLQVAFRIDDMPANSVIEIAKDDGSFKARLGS